MLRLQRGVLDFSPQAQGATGTRTARATRALLRRRLRNAHELEALAITAAVPAHALHHPAVDDGGDAFDGQRRFGDVRCEDHPTTRALVECAILIGGRQRAVEGDDVDVAGERLFVEPLLRAEDLGGAGQKAQDVAAVVGKGAVPARNKRAESADHFVFQRALVVSGLFFHVPHHDGIRAALARDDGAVVEKGGDAGGIQRR